MEKCIYMEIKCFYCKNHQNTFIENFIENKDNNQNFIDMRCDHINIIDTVHEECWERTLDCICDGK